MTIPPTKKTLAKPQRPHSEKRKAVSLTRAVHSSGGSAQSAAAPRTERSRPHERGSSPTRLEASTVLKSGKAAVVVSSGSSITHRETSVAQSGVGSPRAAPPRKLPKLSVISGLVCAPNSSAAEQPSSR